MKKIRRVKMSTDWLITLKETLTEILLGLYNYKD